MPCPADPNPGRDIEGFEADRFHLCENDYPPTNTYLQPLTASKLVSNHLLLNGHGHGHGINHSTAPLHSNGALYSPLKAVPLSSYYKLHRVPSLSSMTEPDSDNSDHVATVPLPRRESTTEPPPERAPENGIHNKILEQVVRTPGRQPSPQPTHLSVPGSSQLKVLQEEGSGYVAPKFEGKELQMDQGMQLRSLPCFDQ